MIPIGKLHNHSNHHLRMVWVHHWWALHYQKRKSKELAAVQFRAARDRLEEARIEVAR